ncbi:MAG: protein kinase [Polyangiales bacterium]
MFDDRPSDHGAAGDANAVDEMLGTVIDGRYRVEAVLGQGGMGLVYRAKHNRLGKTLAIKILQAGARDENALTRFQREAESASAIGDAHIVDVSDFGTLPDGSTYIVMECLEGVDLSRAIESQGPMPVDRACHIGIQLCRALSAAHDIGIVHRDLKPENVFLIERDGDPDFVKVLDFGIAKVAHAVDGLTRDNDFLGTPHYMSPEQCEGRGVDHRTDIYALGVLLYEMVSARVPHDADTAMAILHRHVYERPTPIDLYVPDVPHSLKRIIGRCLTKKPEQRYESMHELKVDLERLQRGEGEPALGLLSHWRDLVPFPSRLSGVGLVVAVVTVVGVLAGITLSQSRDQALTSGEHTVVETERRVPDLLARPEEQSAEPSVDLVAPPASLTRPAEAARARPKAPRRVRKSVQSKPRKPAKPVRQADDVVDPWM